MLPDRGGGHASARGPLQIALLDQIGLEHVFDGVARLADGGGKIVHADRAAAEFLKYRAEQFAVHDVETEMIYIQHGQRSIGDLLSYLPLRLDLGEVTHAAQQT